MDKARQLTDTPKRSLLESLAEGYRALTRLRVLAHILIFTTTLMLPAAILVNYFISEFFLLEGASGLVAEARLAAQKNKELQALLQESLITSDLVYGSAEVYLVPGAIRQNKFVASRIAANGQALGFEAQEVSNALSALSAIESDLKILPRLDEIQLEDHINEFLPRYDDHVDIVIALSQNLIEAAKSQTAKFDAAYADQLARIEREIVIFSTLYLVFVLFALRLHLSQFVRPITRLNLSAQEAISRGSPLDLVLTGPKEYQELALVLRRYDQRLEFRMKIQQLANSLSFQLMKVGPESEIPRIVVSAISESLPSDSVAYIELVESFGGEPCFEQVSGLAQDMGLTPEEIRNLGLSESNSCSFWPKLDPTEEQNKAPLLLTQPQHHPDFEEVVVRTDLLIGVFSKAEISRVYVVRGLVVPERSAENLLALQQISDVLAVLDEKASFDRELEFRVQSRTEELSKQTKIALAAQRAQASFLTTVSHEIRTPFNSLIGMAEVLSQSELNPDQQIAADALANSAKQLLRVVGTMFEYAMLDSDKYELAWSRIDPRTLCEQIRTQYEARAAAQNCVFVVKVDAPNDLSFEFDSQALMRITEVLVDNALRFGAGGRVDFVLSAMAIDQDHLHLKITVSDEGPGVADEQKGGLFEPFVQGGELAQGGLGLGLAIAQRYAKQLGGLIVLETESCKGGQFQVEFTCLQALPLLEELTLIEAASRHLQKTPLRFLLTRNVTMLGNFKTIADRFELPLDFVDSLEEQLAAFLDSPTEFVAVFSQKSALDWFIDHYQPAAITVPPKMILLVESTSAPATLKRNSHQTWLTPITMKRAFEQLINL